MPNGKWSRSSEKGVEYGELISPQEVINQAIEDAFAGSPLQERSKVKGFISGISRELWYFRDRGGEFAGRDLEPGYALAHEIGNHVGPAVEFGVSACVGRKKLESSLEEPEFELELEDLELVATALWFHDLGYLTGPENFARHEEVSMEMAREYLMEQGRDENFITRVEDLIYCTDVGVDVSAFMSGEYSWKSSFEDAAKGEFLCRVVKQADLFSYVIKEEPYIDGNVELYKEWLLRYCAGEDGALYSEQYELLTDTFLDGVAEQAEPFLELVEVYDPEKAQEYRSRAEVTRRQAVRLREIHETSKVDSGCVFEGAVSVRDIADVCREKGIELDESLLDVAREVLVGEAEGLEEGIVRLPTRWIKQVLASVEESERGAVLDFFLERIVARSRGENVRLEELRVTPAVFDEIIDPAPLLTQTRNKLDGEGREESQVCWMIRRENAVERESVLGREDEFVEQVLSLEGVVDAVAIGGDETKGGLAQWSELVIQLIDAGVPVRVYAGQFRSGEHRELAEANLREARKLAQYARSKGVGFRVVGANALAELPELAGDYVGEGVEIESIPLFAREAGLDDPPAYVLEESRHVASAVPALNGESATTLAFFMDEKARSEGEVVSEKS